MPNVRRSAVLWCRIHRASSRRPSVSCHVGCGLYLPGKIGIVLRVGRPNTHIAGEMFVSGFGVFLYISMALWNASVSRHPFGEVFPVIMRLTVLTPTSARQLLWGNAVEDRR